MVELDPRFKPHAEAGNGGGDGFRRDSLRVKFNHHLGIHNVEAKLVDAVASAEYAELPLGLLARTR